MVKWAFCAALCVLVTVAGVAGAGDVDIHGTVSQGFLKSSDYNYLTPNTKDGTFSFNEAIVNVSTRVDDKTRIGVQFLGRDLGGEGNNVFLLDWAFGDYRWKDQLGFRVGKVKTPLGFYNKTRDVDAVRTSVLLPQSVYTEGYRTVSTAFEGASAYGNLAVGSASSLDYEVFGGTIEMNSTDFLLSTVQSAIAGPPVLSYAVEAKYMYGGQLIWNTPVAGLRAGGSFLGLELNGRTEFAGITAAPWAVDMNLQVKSIYVLSAEYLWNDLTLAGEYTRWNVDYSLNNVPFAHPQLGLIGIDVPQHDDRGGWYLQGAYRVSPKLEFGTYYSTFYPDWNDRDGTAASPTYRAWQKDLALTARCDVTDNWILKAEMHLISGVGDVEIDDNPDGFGTENWNMFAAKSTFYF